MIINSSKSKLKGALYSIHAPKKIKLEREKNVYPFQ